MKRILCLIVIFATFNVESAESSQSQENIYHTDSIDPKIQCLKHPEVNLITAEQSNIAKDNIILQKVCEPDFPPFPPPPPKTVMITMKQKLLV